VIYDTPIGKKAKEKKAAAKEKKATAKEKKVVEKESGKKKIVK